MQEITRKKHEEVQEKIRAQLESIKKLIEGVEDLKTSIAKLSKQEQGLVDEINEKISNTNEIISQIIEKTGDLYDSYYPVVKEHLKS